MDNVVIASYTLFLDQTTPKQFCIDWFIIGIETGFNYLQIEKKEHLYFGLLFSLIDREIELIPYWIYKHIDVKLPLITRIVAWNITRKMKKNMKKLTNLVNPIYINILKNNCSVWMSKLNGMKDLGVAPEERIISIQGKVKNKYMAKRIKLCPQN